MTTSTTEDLISLKDAAAILGFKQKNKINDYIKEGYLKTYEMKGSKRMWLSKKEVYSLPQPLPIPPPEEYFIKLKVNERWKKKSSE